MDTKLRNTIMVGTMIVTLSISYFFVIFLPNKEAMRVKELELSNNLNKANKGHPVDYISPASQITDTTSEQPTLDTGDTGQESQPSVNTYKATTNTDLEQAQKDLAKENKKADEEYKKQQESAHKAQLAKDKEAYNTALEKLTRDYEYARDAVIAKANSEGFYKISFDCANGSMDEQRCQTIQRGYAPYENELDYLKKTYDANLKSVTAFKYW